MDYFKRLSNEEYSQAREKLFQIIKCGYSDTPHSYEKISLIKQKNWFAVPIAIEGGFYRNTLEGFVEAAKIFGRSTVIGLWIEADEETPTDYRAFSSPATYEGVIEFNKETDFLLKNNVVFAGNPDWLYIWLNDDINIVYAPESVKELFIETSIDEAFNNFHAWSQSVSEQALKSYLQKIGRTGDTFAQRLYTSLKQFNEASEGKEVRIS